MRLYIGRRDALLVAGPLDIQYDKDPVDYLGTWSYRISIGLRIGPYSIRWKLTTSRIKEKSLARGRKVV